MSDRSSVPYGGTNVWNSYANQTATGIVEVQTAQTAFNVTGTGVVADIDTGVDPGHPALQGVLLAGYDFTRNQPGGSEMTDLNPSDFPTFPPQSCATCQPATVNQSTAAVLDQSTAAVLDGSPYAAFGHGTMVMGIIHLVAPTAQLLPLKAFHADGTAALSDILRAIYYGVQNGANAINMSFDIKTSSTELQKALDYANQQGVMCAASAGNDGVQEIVYPAALQSDVMGVASTSDQDTRSSFSNYGNAIVWVAAPGEAIVSTYPFSSYAAGWGTSFSAPFVSGGAALLHNLRTTFVQSQAATAVAHAVPLVDSGMGNGRLDLCLTLEAVTAASCPQDYSVSATPSTATITAGQQANFTVSAMPLHNSTQTVTWSCTGAPPQATCAVSPSSVTLDGKNAATATVTLTTMARGFSLPLALPRYGPPLQPWWPLVACFAWLAVPVLLWAFSRASRPRRPGLAATAGLLAVSLCTYSCGGYGTPPPPISPTLSSMALNPTTVNGGSSSMGTVTLSGPAPAGGAAVTLTSSSTSTATVPASVTVAAGASSATFTVSTSAVTTSTPVTISASYVGVTQTASLTVVPQALPTLSTLTLNPTSVTGGVQSSTGTVTLSGPALAGGAQVLLSSDNVAANVLSSVTVAAGASSATFTVTTNAVTTSTPVTISASYAGVTKTASLAVAPQALPTLSTLTLNPTSVTGGAQSSTGTVTLSGPAPAGGAAVTLTSSSTSTATVPASVTVAAGASSATFTVSTSAVTTSTPVTISASYAGVTKTASLTVAPPGTPAGTYTLTITGTSGNLSHSITVQVTVN
ncbi:MAG: hypothetical protein DMG52_06320 [Acidobacteria bacterium]|nr:MAG: hypothetical protein DMG52_06320 [Acidobacteriota bacterium]